MSIPQGLPLHARPATLDAMHPLSRQSFIQTPNTGTQPVLVLLASFSDWSGTYTAANFLPACSALPIVSRIIILDASFNQLTLAAVTKSYGTANDGIVGWLNLGYPIPIPDTTDSRNHLIVKNALIAANPYINYAPTIPMAMAISPTMNCTLWSIVAGLRTRLQQLVHPMSGRTVGT